MCDRDDFETPVSRRVITRRARKRHRCCECRGLIEPGVDYEEYRILMKGHGWSRYKTCQPCAAIAGALFVVYGVGGLLDCLVEDYDLSDRRDCFKARTAYAGMLRRRRQARRILRQEQADA
jgi:hypothetical protein